MSKRPYTPRRRAERQAQTRQRIVDAAMALHEELGPAGTTISAIAERAGVQRLTVYRHFPDEAVLFAACTSKWLSLNPPPDGSEWMPIPEPLPRCAAALFAFYRYYRRTEAMWAASYRDEKEVPALKAEMAKFHAYLDEVRGGLLRAFPAERRGTGPLAATLGHCLRFPTWASLAAQGLDDGRMAALALRWVEAAAQTIDLEPVPAKCDH